MVWVRDGTHKLIESQSGRQMLVWRSPDSTLYVFQVKAHIMKSEKKIICVLVSQDARAGEERNSCLNANRQRIQSISNISSSPKISPVNDAAFQRIKLYQRQTQQLSERRAAPKNYDSRQKTGKM
jgi:hypothetical protein